MGVTEVFGEEQQTYIFNQSQFTRLFSTTGASITGHNSGNCGLLGRQNIKPYQHKNINLVL